jgi:hypothetical protein
LALLEAPQTGGLFYGPKAFPGSAVAIRNGATRRYKDQIGWATSKGRQAAAVAGEVDQQIVTGVKRCGADVDQEVGAGDGGVGGAHEGVSENACGELNEGGRDGVVSGTGESDGERKRRACGGQEGDLVAVKGEIRDEVGGGEGGMGEAQGELIRAGMAGEGVGVGEAINEIRTDGSSQVIVGGRSNDVIVFDGANDGCGGGDGVAGA